MFLQILRLGFHDCLPYEDLGSQRISGCDGCLSNEGVLEGISVQEYYNTSKHGFNGPDQRNITNNGLLFVADVLEEIYSNRSFPESLPSLKVSMKESGKSRADLWAFAALIAAEYGIEMNNLDCDGKGIVMSNKCIET